MGMRTNAEMLKNLKSYNKIAREGKAKREGFMSAATMIHHLEHQISSGRGNDPYISTEGDVHLEPSKEVSNDRTTIHVVDVLDASGSMAGAKYNAAVKGINLGVESLKADSADVKYTYTLCDFSNDIILRHKTQDLKYVNTFKGTTRGATALYDAIGKSIQLIKEVARPTDKVLVNVYTDGQENGSRLYSSLMISNLIEDLSKQGWTFTFIGTESDVKYAQRNLKFHDSNTLIYDNTGEGLEKAFITNTLSRQSYSAKVEKGEDVSTGFYKDIDRKSVV